MSFVEATLATLPRDAVISIARRTEPKALLELCKTNKRFSEFCRKQSFWAQMMNHHYPEFPHTDDARKQFQALTEGVTTSYGFNTLNMGPHLSGVAGDEFLVKAKTIQPMRSYVKVLGRPFPNNTKRWCCFVVAQTAKSRFRMFEAYKVYADRAGAEKAAIMTVRDYIRGDLLDADMTEWSFWTERGRSTTQPTDEEIVEIFTQKTFQDCLQVMTKSSASKAYFKVHVREMTFVDTVPQKSFFGL